MTTLNTFKTIIDDQAGTMTASSAFIGDVNLLRPRKVIAVIVAGFSILIADQASATEETTIYPASMCVPWNASDPMPRLASSRIFNDTANVMRVDCPLLHQRFSRPLSYGPRIVDGGRISPGIGVIDTHTQQNARCWLVSAHQSGATLVTVGYGGTRNTVGFGSHEQNLEFGQTKHNFDSWAYIGCLIPPRQNGQSSGITYYRNREL